MRDVGANAYLAFHESDAKRLGLRKGSESKQGKNAFNQDTVSYSKLDPLKIKIGSLKLQHFNHAYQYDKSWGKSSFSFRPYDGIAGLSFLKEIHYNIFVSYKKGFMRLIPYGSDLNTRYSSQQFIRLNNENKITFSREKIENKEVHYIWDTGSTDSMILRYRLLPQSFMNEEGNFLLPVHFQDKQIILDFTPEDTNFRWEGIFGIIGYNFFIHHDVFFDLENSVLYLT